MLKKKIIVSCLSFSLFACLFATSYHVKAVDFEGKESQYIKLFKEYGLNAVILDCTIDNNFITFLEYKEHGVRFKRRSIPS